MRIITLLITCAAFSFFSCEQKKEAANTDTIMLNNDADKVSYSLGAAIGRNLKNEGFDSLNFSALYKAIDDAYHEKPLLIAEEETGQIINNHLRQRQQNKASASMNKGHKFLEENKSKEGVVTLASGLQYQVLKEGAGPMPKLTDKVTTHYHGMLIDGTVFDSSVERGEPATFGVNQVIPGWTEALQLMKTGSKWKLFIPSNLAYGERGAGGRIGPNETLIFEVELLGIAQ